jgi:hypothetical protein
MSYPNHPIFSTPEEYEEHQAAMNELCDKIEAETPDFPLPKNFKDWVKQGDARCPKCHSDDVSLASGVFVGCEASFNRCAECLHEFGGDLE